MIALMIALQVAAALPAQPLVPVVEPSGRVAKVLAKGDGRTQKTAYRVRSTREEYEILRVFGLEPGVQSLVVNDDGKAFDLIEAKNPTTGDKVELWFDISAFYGAGF